MDNVTHGLAGMLMADITVQAIAHRTRRPVPPRLRRAAVVLGIVAAEFPDTDLVYSGPLVGMGQLGYLLHHRGHTHTLVWASLSALLLWWMARWYVNRSGGGVDGYAQRQAALPLFALAMAGTWSHILLDWTNSYGVHPFWPFDNRWFYGDAIFIVEPWLWLVAIAPLVWGARSRGGRVVLAVLAVVILAASFLLGQVARELAWALLAFALVWGASQRVIAPARRAWAGLALWVVAELAFFSAAAVTRSTIVAPFVSGSVVDVVLNPAPADPTCWSALVVTRDGNDYRLTSAVVGPFGVRPVSACVSTYASGRVGADVLAPLPTSTRLTGGDSFGRVAWRSTWAMPVDSLRALAAARCEVAAALRFMRTPVWMPTGDSLLVADVRYGVGGGFNQLYVPAQPSGGCPIDGKWVPAWTPPRAALLRP